MPLIFNLIYLFIYLSDIIIQVWHILLWPTSSPAVACIARLLLHPRPRGPASVWSHSQTAERERQAEKRGEMKEANKIKNRRRNQWSKHNQSASFMYSHRKLMECSISRFLCRCGCYVFKCNSADVLCEYFCIWKCPPISLTHEKKSVCNQWTLHPWLMMAHFCMPVCIHVVFLPCWSFRSVYFHKWSCRRRWEWWPFSIPPLGSESSPGWVPPCRVWNRSCDCLRDKPTSSKRWQTWETPQVTKTPQLKTAKITLSSAFNFQN